MTTNTNDMSNDRPRDGHEIEDDALMAEVESLLASEEGERSSNGRRSERQGWKEWLRTTTNGQVLYVGLLAGLLPGAVTALEGMGGGGNMGDALTAKSTTVTLAASAASYLLLCIPLFELAGVRIVGIGGWAYVLYPAAVLYYSFYHDAGLVTAASMLLGLGGALLWVGQGAIVVSNPAAHQKARAIVVFWVTYNLGIILSALVALVSNYHHPNPGTVSNRTYVVFIWVALLGASFASRIANPWEVKRPDGTAPWSPPKGRSRSRSCEVFKRESLSILSLRHDRRIVMLLPLFLASSWFSSHKKTLMVRTSADGVSRMVSLTVFHLPECVGALVVLLLIEQTRFQHNLRLLLLWLTLFVLANLVMLISAVHESATDSDSSWIAISSIGGLRDAGTMSLLVWYGLLDGLWQNTCYYLLGCLSSSPGSAARLVAVYKLCQTINQMITHHMVTRGVSDQVQVSLNWVLIFVALLCALPTIRRLDDPKSQDSSPRLPPEVVVEDLGGLEMSRA